MIYKGYVIEPAKSPWEIKYNLGFRFYREEIVHHADTLREAMEIIDEKTANEQLPLLERARAAIKRFLVKIKFLPA